MKQLILQFSDSNMAGYSWRWEFYLTSSKSEGFTLSSRQIAAEDRPMTVDPVGGLRDGVDVYEALNVMVSEAGYSLDENELPTIASEIAKLNAVVAEQFQCGPVLAQERYENERKKAADERGAILRPCHEIIDNYVLRFSDEPLRYPGGGQYGTRRGWAKRFIEDYVVANGRLPTGEHLIEVRSDGASYSGGSHDFSDLK